MFFTRRNYGTIAAENYAWYALYFAIAALLYFVFVWPAVLFLCSLVFGPGVVLFGLVHAALHVNLWTMQWLRGSCRSTHRRLAVRMSRVENFPPLMYPISSDQYVDTLHPSNVRHLGFWVNDLPWMVAKSLLLVVWALFKCLLSLVPIVGLFAVAALEAPSTGWEYCDALRPGIGFYEDYARYLLLGLGCTALDMIPVLSGLTFTTNTIACGIMMKDEY